MSSIDSNSTKSEPTSSMTKVLRVAGSLTLLALVIEAVSLMWRAPLAFLLFAFVGGAFFAAGVLIYLYSIVRHS
jgi:hypothetical protein